MLATLNKRLKALRMNYSQYLKSPLWAAARERYFRHGGARECLICANPRIQLHHITYARVGNELPGDLMPLCDSCHRKIHQYHKNHSTNLQHIGKIIRAVFGWSRAQTQIALLPYNVGGIKDAHIHPDGLTPKQKAREKRKSQT